MDLAGELDGRGGPSLKTLPYDPAEFLDDETAMADYLRLTARTEVRRRLRGRSAPSRARHDRNRGQDWHYAPRALQGAERRGNPELATVAKVAEAFGLRLTFEPLAKPLDRAAA
jgi:DNA-binding phage protein